eukprot:jgi/Tetstr1/465871/TSEL_010488.t1
MEIHGSKASFNLEAVLRKNIVDSDYYRSISSCESWSEVVDEIYETVTSVEPWLTGNARGPSTAFCCLHRLFTLGLNRREINDTISHPDSPFIRAIGFLYLRYVCRPDDLWSFIEDYVDDPEEFEPSPYGGKTTMGAFVRDIMLKQFYFETIFPRIPVVVERAMKEELRKRGLPTEAVGNGGTGGPDRRGVDEPNKRPPSVKAALSVSHGQTAPNRRAARESTFRVAGYGRDGKERMGDGREGERGRDRGKDRGRDGRDVKPYRPDHSSADRDRRDRDDVRKDRRGDRKDERRDRDRDRRDRDRDRGGYGDRRDRDRDRGYDSRRERDRRGGSRDRGRDRSPERRHRYGSRDRSRSRERGASRDAADVFRDSAPRDTRDVFRDAAPVAPSLGSRY